ncbi:hypothetical protein JA1_003142 [Spathaspora sp. JA1]|nr:hypothetical protein JA1_003142 [Spathaspora sp. JA1]
MSKYSNEPKSITQSPSSPGLAAANAALRMHSPVTSSPSRSTTTPGRTNSLRSNSLRQYTYNPKPSYTVGQATIPNARRYNSLTNKVNAYAQYAGAEDEEDMEETVVTTTTTKVVDSHGRTQSISTKTVTTYPDGSNVIETKTKNISRTSSRTNSLSSNGNHRVNSLTHSTNLTKIDEQLQNFEYDYQVDSSHLDSPDTKLKLNLPDNTNHTSPKEITPIAPEKPDKPVIETEKPRSILKNTHTNFEETYEPLNDVSSPPSIPTPSNSISFNDRVKTIPVYSEQKTVKKRRPVSTVPPSRNSEIPDADFYAAAMAAAYKKVYGDRAEPAPIPTPIATASPETSPKKSKFGFMLPHGNTPPKKEIIEQGDIPERYSGHHRQFAIHSMRDDVSKVATRKDRAKLEKKQAKEEADRQKRAIKEQEASEKKAAKEKATLEKKLKKEREELDRKIAREKELEEKRLARERVEEEKRLAREKLEKERAREEPAELNHEVLSKQESRDSKHRSKIFTNIFARHHRSVSNSSQTSAPKNEITEPVQPTTLEENTERGRGQYKQEHEALQGLEQDGTSNVQGLQTQEKSNTVGAVLDKVKEDGSDIPASSPQHTSGAEFVDVNIINEEEEDNIVPPVIDELVEEESSPDVHASEIANVVREGKSEPTVAKNEQIDNSDNVLEETTPQEHAKRAGDIDSENVLDNPSTKDTVTQPFFTPTLSFDEQKLQSTNEPTINAIEIPTDNTTQVKEAEPKAIEEQPTPQVSASPVQTHPVEIPSDRHFDINRIPEEISPPLSEPESGHGSNSTAATDHQDLDDSVAYEKKKSSRFKRTVFKYFIHKSS